MNASIRQLFCLFHDMQVAYRRHVRHLKVRYVIGLGKALDEYVPPHVRLAAGSTVDKRMVGKMMDDDPQVMALVFIVPTPLLDVCQRPECGVCQKH